MNLLNKIYIWFKSFLYPIRHEKKSSDHEPAPPIHFSSITTVDSPPTNAKIIPNHFFYVRHNNSSKWVLFLCPCGCRNVITLSLQSSHKPHWQLTLTSNNRPTLYPSIWRDKGCLSHFWLRDGRIFWCHDTGTLPIFN